MVSRLFLQIGTKGLLLSDEYERNHSSPDCSLIVDK
jgi:hypothetical protein